MILIIQSAVQLLGLLSMTKQHLKCIILHKSSKFLSQAFTGPHTYQLMIQPKRVEFVEDSWKNQLTVNGIESPE